MNQMEKTNKIVYLEHLRIISMICVIIMHVSAGLLSGKIDTTWQFLNIFTSISFIAVPIFFMISGVVILESKNTEDPTYILKKRIPKLLIPLIIWSIIAILPGYLSIDATQNGFQFYSFFKSLLMIPSGNIAVHLWFMYFLIPLYLLSPFLRILVNHMKKKNVQYLFILWICNVLLITFREFLPESLHIYAHIDFIEKLHFLGGYLGFFFAGYYLHHYKKKVSNKLLVGTLVTVSTIIILGTSFLSIYKGVYIGSFQSVGCIFTTILSVTVFLLVKQNVGYKQKYMNPVVSILATNSFCIYLMHNTFISLFSYYIWGATNALMAVTLLFITLSFCLISGIILSSFKWLSFVFTGVPYKKACDSCNYIYIKKSFHANKKI